MPDKHSKTKHKSLDCSIMDVADDIAYGVHDLEDAIALRLITQEQFAEAVPADLSRSFTARYRLTHDQLLEDLFGDQRKRMIGRLVDHFMVALAPDEQEFEEPLLRFRVKLTDEERHFLDALKRLVSARVVKSPNVQHLELKGQRMVVAVFEAIQSDPEKLLPCDQLERIQRRGFEVSRGICDYVAGMTDNYLLRTYERMFSPRMGSVFDRL